MFRHNVQLYQKQKNGGTSMEKNPYEIIRTNYLSYSKVFRVIADYILNHSDEVLKTNIHKLGRDLDIAGRNCFKIRVRRK